jgi:hypothetical protein
MLDSTLDREIGMTLDPYQAPGYWKKSPDTYKLEAYALNGRFLWRHDMGWSIEAGTWYAPYAAYDVDGKAEVYCKHENIGSLAPSTLWRDADPQKEIILKGKLMKFQGETIFAPPGADRPRRNAGRRHDLTKPSRRDRPDTG